MRQGEIIRQLGGTWRHLYVCPRGTVSIDEHRDGRREVTRCLGGSRLTARDERDAIQLHEMLLAEVE